MPESASEFEVHVTVRTERPDEVEALQAWAEGRGLKSHHIVLDGGVSPIQPMVTRRGKGNRSEAMSAAAEVAAEVAAAGFAVSRVKLEVAPHGDGVPQKSGEAYHPEGYFEHHVKLLLRQNADLEALTVIATRHHARLSRNARRLRNDGLSERFLTQRYHYGGRELATERLNALTAELIGRGYSILAVEQEYVVYDSAPRLDAGWFAVNADMPNFYPHTFTPANPAIVRPRLFEPALQQFRSAFRAGDPVIADAAAAARWAELRRLANDHVLRSVAESAWGDRLILRGSRLLPLWLGEAAREPGDLDWVAEPTAARPGDPAVDAMLAGLAEATFAGPSPIGVRFDRAAVATDDIWTYERAPGRRIVFPWQAGGLPGGAVQIDIVFGETLDAPAERIELPVEDGGSVAVRAASGAQSLAWKLLWLVTDMYPQGKDLYDAVLLAERFELPFRLLEATLRRGDVRSIPRTAADVIHEFGDRVDWGNFRAEYFGVEGDAAVWLGRLEEALRPTFVGVW